jgi:hypothetical protein
MFRVLKLKPPQGWDAVVWELVIVTVGVLMALALQQWVEDLGSRARTNRARDAIHKELGDHYLNAVELRTLSPCVAAQLNRIESRIVDSGATLQPIEARSMDNEIPAAVMFPSRIYDDSAWRGSVEDGTAFELTDRERRGLTNEYWLAKDIGRLQDELSDADQRLLAATRPLQLDAGVKLDLLHSIDRMRTVNKRLSRSAAEIMYWVAKLGAAPSPADTKADLERNGWAMLHFCAAQHFPTRPFAKAIDPNS